MARFIFRLQPVLKQRQAVERQRQLALAAVESERSSLENAIRGIQSDLSAAKQDWREHLSPAITPGSGGTDLRSARFQASNSLHLVARAQHNVLKLAGVHRRIDKARAELIEATTRRRAVELLRDKQFEAWKAALNKADAAATDEIAVAAAARTMEDE